MPHATQRQHACPCIGHVIKCSGRCADETCGVHLIPPPHGTVLHAHNGAAIAATAKQRLSLRAPATRQALRCGGIVRIGGVAALQPEHGARRQLQGAILVAVQV